MYVTRILSDSLNFEVGKVKKFERANVIVKLLRKKYRGIIVDINTRNIENKNCTYTYI